MWFPIYRETICNRVPHDLPTLKSSPRMNYRYIDPCLDRVKPSERWSKLYGRKFSSVDWKNLEMDPGDRRRKPNNTGMEYVDWKIPEIQATQTMEPTV